MNRVPAVVSAGICSCAGEGEDLAWELATLRDAKALKKLATFVSPRHGDKLVASAPKKGSRCLSDCAKILFSAVDEAMSKVDSAKIDSTKFGVFFGTSIGGIFETENQIKENLEQGDVFKNLSSLTFYECSTLAELVAKRVGARGECATYSTACSSSTLALASACESIEQGYLDVALVCGADSLSRTTVNGFGSLLLLSKGECKPFDARRDGINLGEAAGALLLVSSSLAEKLNFKVRAKISAWACTADAYHPTAPRPDGSGAAAASKKALARAGLSAEEISYVNAHGTGTLGNDSAEASALKLVFPDKVPPFSSVKGTFGHTLGAAGILNAVLSLKALESNTLPPNAGFEVLDEAIALSPITQAQACDIQNVLTLSLGFGGNNAAAILSRETPARALLGRKRLFLYGAGALSPVCDDAEKIREAVFAETPITNLELDEDTLLKDVSPLKKRKLAKMQQMFSEVVSRAMAGLAEFPNPDDVAVCFGTGSGMCVETERFVLATILKNEAEPLPTAFTNSVHNAPASAVALRFGFRGLNSAVTAKEISFESALIQAWREVSASCASVAIAGCADESTPYAREFLQKNAKAKVCSSPLVDTSAAYVLGAEGAFSAMAKAEILAVDIARRNKNASAEFVLLKNLIEDAGVSLDEIEEIFVPYAVSAEIARSLASLEKSFARKFKCLATSLGSSPSTSGLAIFSSLSKRGIFAQYTAASCGMRAFTLWKNL